MCGVSPAWKELCDVTQRDWEADGDIDECGHALRKIHLWVKALWALELGNRPAIIDRPWRQYGAKLLTPKLNPNKFKIGKNSVWFEIFQPKSCAPVKVSCFCNKTEFVFLGVWAQAPPLHQYPSLVLRSSKEIKPLTIKHILVHTIWGKGSSPGEQFWPKTQSHSFTVWRIFQYVQSGDCGRF